MADTVIHDLMISVFIKYFIAKQCGKPKLKSFSLHPFKTSRKRKRAKEETSDVHIPGMLR